jgi:hypothetical protein
VHDDLFWHLRTGEWIAAHHQVPLADLFSYTRPGARWITHEWGFSLLSFLVWRAAGVRGLVALTPLLAAAIFAAVAWRSRELAAAAAAATTTASTVGETGASAAGPAPCLLLAALTALGLWAASPELFLRAALAGELMLALALAGLARYRRTGRRRWLAAVAALFWPWANLHSGVVFGLFVLALHALHAIEPPTGAFRAGWAKRAAPYLWTLAAAAALTLVNPNGLDAPLYPFILGRILFASGIPWELGHFSAGAPAGGAVNAPLWLLLVLLLLSLLPLRQARRLSPAEAAAIGSFALLSLFSHRFVFDLVVIGIPSLYKLLVLPPAPARSTLPAAPAPPAAVPAPAVSTLSTPSTPSNTAAADEPKLPPWARSVAGRPGVAAALAALFLLPVAPAAMASAVAGWARRPPAAGGLIAEPFPAAALRFAEAQGIAGPADRIFNHQNYGGFIGWRLRVPVFWDGRNDVFFDLVREVATTQFGAVAERYRVDYLLITEHDYPGIVPEIAAGRWGLVYWDDFCALYLRRGERYAAPLGRFEMHLFPPFGGRPGLAALAADRRLAAAARAELAQVLALNPANQRALYFAGVISLYRGELSRAAAELRAAQALRPADQVDQALALVGRIRRATGK